MRGGAASGAPRPGRTGKREADGRRRRPRHPLWRALKIAAGLAMLALGVVGLFLPILQGILFLLIGIAILSSESRRVRRLRDALRARYPGPWEAAERTRMRLAARWAALFGEGSSTEAPGDEG